MAIFSTTDLYRGTSAYWIVSQKIKESGLEAAARAFKELWDNRALDLEFTEADLNKLGYIYLNEGKLEEALMVFKLNVDAFPQSSNVYDSYGEALMKNGNTTDAITNYQKSISMDPDNENAREMLKKLNSEDQ